MNIWDALDLEQYVVILIAKEEGYLNDVIGEYGMRLRWAKTGDARLSSNLDDAAKLALVPKFARVVARLLLRNLIDVSGLEVPDESELSSMTEDEIAATLSDPRIWINMGEDSRMIMVTITDHWDELVSSASAE